VREWQLQTVTVVLKQDLFSKGIIIQFRNEEESKAFHCAFEQWKKEADFQGVCFDY